MKIKFNRFFREELTINDIQAAIENGEVTSKELVMYYLDRIAKYDQDLVLGCLGNSFFIDLGS